MGEIERWVTYDSAWRVDKQQARTKRERIGRWVAIGGPVKTRERERERANRNDSKLLV